MKIKIPKIIKSLILDFRKYKEERSKIRNKALVDPKLDFLDVVRIVDKTPLPKRLKILSIIIKILYKIIYVSLLIYFIYLIILQLQKLWLNDG